MTVFAALAAVLLAAPATVDVSGLDDLPLTVVPSEGPTTSYAVFMTGDGGWATLAETVSAGLARKGVETIGFSTLRYCWDPKSPQQTAAGLNRIFEAIHAAAPGARVNLIGFSYGAAIEPIVYPMLSQTARGMIGRMSLMMPDAKAGIVPDGPLADPPVYDFSTTFWAEDDPAFGYDVAAAIRADTAVPILCLNSDDDDGACSKLGAGPPDNVTVKVLGSGHHFSERYDELAEIIQP